MADVQWIKIYTNMFDISRKIKHIERMLQGDTILIIWFKLLLLAGKCNDSGAIYVTPKIPFDIDGLAAELRKEDDIKIVETALSVFEMYDMIERENGYIYISSWEEYQNIEGLERIKDQTRKRVAKHREKKKISEGNVTSNVTVTLPVTLRNATDKEEDKEKEEESEIIKKKTKKKQPAKKAEKADKPEKLKRGEYQHVLLTAEEEDKLIEEHGMTFALKAITFLDEYIEETGYKRKNHYLCIKRWVMDAVKEKEEKAIKSGKAPKQRYGDFDPAEAHRLALERTYGKEANTKTAATDAALRERMEALQNKLS